MKIHFSILFIFGLLTLPMGCKDSGGEEIDVNQEILEAMEESGIPSVVAGVVSDDELIWEGTYGFSNLARGTQADRYTLYTIMSIGKVMLSTATFQIWERGLIDLNADINQYLPFEVRNPNHPSEVITVEMLLNHRSSLAWPEAGDGIFDFHHFYSVEDPPQIRDWLPQYIVPGGSYYKDAVWKNFPPGDQFLYSNIGTSLLALVLEEITGMDYRDYCKINIFEPLEMHNTAFRLGKLNPDLLVTPYDDNGYPMSYYACRHYPAGFISSNLEDFSHFAMAILNKGVYKGNRIIDEATLDRMLTLQDPTSGTANLWVHCLGDCIGHLGGGTGFSTWAEWHFEGGRALFIFSNRVNGSISPVGRIYELIKYRAYEF